MLKSQHTEEPTSLALRAEPYGRWLLAREALMCQGFPIDKSMSSGVMACSFAVEAGLAPARSRSAQIQQVGQGLVSTYE